MWILCQNGQVTAERLERGLVAFRECCGVLVPGKYQVYVYTPYMYLGTYLGIHMYIKVCFKMRQESCMLHDQAEQQ